MFENLYQNLNGQTDFLQKTAWRLVRAAEDLFGSGKGDEKRAWCIRRMKESIHAISITDSEAEDYIRASFMNFKIEMGATERKF